MADSPDKAKDSKFVVNQEYINYIKVQRLLDKRAGHPTSAYAAYDPNGQKGTHIEHGTRVPGEKFKEYPARTELAQSDRGYDKAHPREGRLPKDAAGRRNVYGEHEEMPLEGPVNWTEFYKKWSDVGPQLKLGLDPIASTEPLNKSELDFCRKYGFEFKKKLGAGGFGSAWTVDWHQKDSKGNPFKETYAVKVMDINRFLMVKTTLDEAVVLMLQEAELTKDLIHDNIVRVENIFHIHDEETGFPMVRVLLFMTLCDGDLAQILNKKGWWPGSQKLSENEARLVMWDICQGLKYIHDRNIAHLDTKPDNILFKGDPLSGQGHYMLGDFGLSKAFSSADTKMENKLKGVFRYMPPEMSKLGHSDAKLVDIYSLGTTLAEMLVTLYRMLDCRWDLWQLNPRKPTPNYKPDPTTMKDLQSKWSLSFHALDLIRKMTILDVERRPTIDQVIADDWFKQTVPIPPSGCTLS